MTEYIKRSRGPYNYPIKKVEGRPRPTAVSQYCWAKAARNPWESVSLEDYEDHMSLDSVRQLQVLSEIMRCQFFEHFVSSVVIFGIAGGNGLEHVPLGQIQKVYGIDVNKDYLIAATERHPELDSILECLRFDLRYYPEKVPKAELVLANLVVEYIGYEAFKADVQSADPQYVSCVVQINSDDDSWVSDSPLVHKFDRLDEIHQVVEPQELKDQMAQIGYYAVKDYEYATPNGKKLLRTDFVKMTRGGRR